MKEMDYDELHIGDIYINSELDSSECCIYCGKESDNLNIVCYEINPNNYADMRTVSINHKPHEKRKWTKGWVRRFEYVCDKCLKEEY